MSNHPVHPDFPDHFFELMLSADDDAPIPTVKVKRKEGKLIDGVYHLPGGFKARAEEFKRMGRNDRGGKLCRSLRCLENEIPQAIERLRKDMALETAAMLKHFQEANEFFAKEPEMIMDTYRHPLLTMKKPQDESPSP